MNQTPEVTGAPRRWTRAAGWWLAAGTFVLGVVAGGLLVGLASSGSSAGTGPAAENPSVAAVPPGTPAAGQYTVNAACIRAVNEAQDTYGAINDLADAAAALSAARLDEIVRRLQPLQRRLEQDLRACRIATRLPDGSVSSGPVPSATPTS